MRPNVSPSDAPVLSLEKVTKTFPGVRALSEVSIDLYPGKVTALVGENGAGKSTVVKTLTGIYQPDDGEIRVDGKPLQFPTPQSAENAGVTAIHQETVLFDEFGLIDTRAMHKGAQEILDGLGAKIDPAATLKDLGTANKHLVAISRALSVDARVVIMDEPTAALSRTEIEELYELVDGLKAQGM